MTLDSADALDLKRLLDSGVAGVLTWLGSVGPSGRSILRPYPRLRSFHTCSLGQRRAQEAGMENRSSSASGGAWSSW